MMALMLRYIEHSMASFDNEHLHRYGSVYFIHFYCELTDQLQSWEIGSLQLLPSSAQHCAEDEFDPPKNWGEIFTHVSVSGGCSDLIYSGHMMYAILATCAICNLRERR